MRNNSEDKTIERNYLQKWRFLISEYELTKQKKHPKFKFVNDFYKHHKTNRQTFIKYYNRYLQNASDQSLLPRKRGPKWKSRRPLPVIEQQVLSQRRLGINRFEICEILRPKLKSHTPSPSGVYNICRRHGLGRLTVKHKENKRRIVKEKAGELGHIDCHHLSQDLITGATKRYYLVCVVDSCTRLAWAEVVEDVKSISVMFAALKSMNMINARYKVQFQEVITDNGSEFKSISEDKMHHPFERMLIELGIRHRYTKAYRPQTNGKAERFWRTLNEDLIEGTTFDSIDHFQDELQQYLLYYNEHRPHQGLNGAVPFNFKQNLSTN
jgi:transposase InsO family protein